MIVNTFPVSTCIIDNNTTYVYGFKKLLSLKNLSSQISTFNNGSEAITYLKNPLNVNNLPDIIFLDISMPVMDGWEFMDEFAEIKSQLGKKITIYILSSSADNNDIERAKKNSDISDYIIKPADVSRLAKIFRDLNATN